MARASASDISPPSDLRQVYPQGADRRWARSPHRAARWAGATIRDALSEARGTITGVPTDLVARIAAAAEPAVDFLGWSADQWAVAESVATAVGVLGVAGSLVFAALQVRMSRQAAVEQAFPAVIVTPIAELSDGRQACLLIRNYGPTIAHDIRVTFPDERVLTDDHSTNERRGAPTTGGRELRLPVTALAPGQEVSEWVTFMSNQDSRGVRSATVEVTYLDWQKKRHEHRYRISHGPTSLWGNRAGLSDAVSELREIRRTLDRWSAPDRRSLTVETPTAAKHRIFGGPRFDRPRPDDAGSRPADPDQPLTE